MTFLLLATAGIANAQITNDEYTQVDENGNVITQSQKKRTADSLGTDKEIPKGIKVWTVDPLFGDRTPAELDTVPHNFMNTIFTTGMRGEYNSLGNLGSPRIARIYIDRGNSDEFFFIDPYDFFITSIEDFHFTNTLSPFTNLTYNSCGNRTDGEDHFTAKFGVNAGKKLGFGFKFDYLYGRGYYSDQSTSHFDYTMYGSYIGDRYQAHLLMSTNHQKVAENGGITNDNYITHPEIYSEDYATSEIPTMLTQNWNRNDNQHVFFTQRYSVGFHRKVPMTKEEIEAKKFAIQAKKDAEARKKAKEEGYGSLSERQRDERDNKRGKDADMPFKGRPDDAKIAQGKRGQQPDKAGERVAVNGKAASDSLLAAQRKAAEDTSWMKSEYVPVTSFIHTAQFDTYRRIYQAYSTPTDYYLNTYDVDEKLTGDSIYDKTQYWHLQNVLALSLLEGFNKWAKAGIKIFALHELRHYSLPDSVGRYSWNKSALSVGGQISKTLGKTFHYNVTGMVGVMGDDAGEIHIDASADVNFPLFGDTVTLAAGGFYYHEVPSSFLSTYHSKHFWWDNDLDMMDRFRVQGTFAYQKTRTKLRVAFDELRNYIYLSSTYTTSDDQRIYNDVTVKQSSSPITLLTAELSQDFTLGPVNWENVVTFQKCTDDDVIAVPTLNVYSNLYLKFKIAHVLSCDFGADVRYFTKYAAPVYVPAIGYYASQGNDTKDEVGGYPLVNLYANFHLKHTRFFVMLSHVNAGSGNKEYFFTPHYPLNGRVFRFGLSWNFWN